MFIDRSGRLDRRWPSSQAGAPFLPMSACAAGQTTRCPSAFSISNGTTPSLRRGQRASASSATIARDDSPNCRLGGRHRAGRRRRPRENRLLRPHRSYDPLHFLKTRGAHREHHDRSGPAFSSMDFCTIFSVIANKRSDIDPWGSALMIALGVRISRAIRRPQSPATSGDVFWNSPC